MHCKNDGSVSILSNFLMSAPNHPQVTLHAASLATDAASRFVRWLPTSRPATAQWCCLVAGWSLGLVYELHASWQNETLEVVLPATRVASKSKTYPCHHQRSYTYRRFNKAKLLQTHFKKKGCPTHLLLQCCVIFA